MEPPHRYSVVSSQGDYCLSSSNTAGQHSRQSSISYGGRPPSAQSSIRPSTCRSGRSSSIRPGTPGLCFILVSRLCLQWMFEFPLFNTPRDDGLSKYSKKCLLLERWGRILCNIVISRDLCCLLSRWWKGRWMHWAEYWTQGGEQTSCTARDDECAHLPSRSQLPSHHVTIFLAPLPIWPKQYVHAADPSHIEIWSTVSPYHMSHCRWAKHVFDGHSRLYKILSILNYLAFAGPGRQVLDKSYYMSRLRSKKQELQSEINSMSDEIERMQRRGPAAFQLEQK